MIIEVELILISYDANSGMPIIFLREKTDRTPRRILPIWIGFPETAAMARKIKKEKPPRPMTHDLMLNIINELGATVKAILMHSRKESTFYGKIILERNKKRNREYTRINTN